MSTVGAIWTLWDLHIHTPISFHWSDGSRFHKDDAEKHDETCKAIIDRINDLDVVAFCVMDYWTFDGYLALREYLSRHPDATTKRIFPGIELRMPSPTKYRLNIHALLNDELSDEKFANFLSHLKLAGSNKPATRDNFIDLAKEYGPDKLKLYGCESGDRADDEKMLLVGHQSAEVTLESFKEAIKLVGEENCLVVLPFDTSDGLEKLDWEEHPYYDQYVMRFAHCFESRNPNNVDLFLGKGHKTKPEVGADFIHNLGGYPKPVFSGSDAHKISDYGVYPSERATWLKALPTFKGLQQVCNEPTLRCFVGKRPPKLDHISQNSTKYIKSIKLEKTSECSEKWFDGVEVTFNPGLCAIIGNRGSGKSALADIIALAGNSHCSQLEFLNDERFRRGDNKAQHFTATLNWMEGDPSVVTLDQNADRQQPERVRYLPQHFIEHLCNEIASGNDTSFEKELRKVIFSHVPKDDQLRQTTLDQLIEYRINPRKAAILQLRQSLYTLNDTIVQNENEISEEMLTSYRSALKLKQEELAAHEKTKPAEVVKPPEDPDDEKTKGISTQIEEKQKELEGIKSQLIGLREEKGDLTAQQALLGRISGYVDNFETVHTTFVEERTVEFEDAGLVIDDIVKVQIDREPINKLLSAATTRLAEIGLAIDGVPATENTPAVEGLAAKETKCSEAITKLQDGLNAPQKAHQAYLTELAKWTRKKATIVGNLETPETIEYFQERIKRATEVIPKALDELRTERKDLVRQIHEELLAMRKVYEDLYAPIQKIAKAAAKSPDSINIEFDAYLSTHSFEENFLDFIHKNRKGSFYGEDESRAAVRKIVRSHDFTSTESATAFTEAIIAALNSYEHDGQKRSATIQSQLRQQKKVSGLYDFVFAMDYIDIRYTLRLDGKEISELSPGEKGALLLVFYLLMDTEEIPIIIDQPEHNLDNESVVRLLVDCIRRARDRRQVLIVTHNPNLAVYCDADQVICCHIDKTDGNRIKYSTGAIEDYKINRTTVNVLEGTYAAFDNRRKKYHKPEDDFAVVLLADIQADGDTIPSEHAETADAPIVST